MSGAKGSGGRIGFWMKWLESDDIERLKLVETLGIHKTAIALKDSNSVGASFATLLNAYFEDLAEAARNKEAGG